MNLPDFLTRHRYGEIRLTGHRIGLFHLVECHNRGQSAASIAEEYPTLPLQLIEKAIGYYLANQAEVDTYVVACREEIDRQAAASQPGPDLAELRQRMRAK